MGPREHRGDRPTVTATGARPALALTALALLVAPTSAAAPDAAVLALLVVGGDRFRSIDGLVGAIAAGAVAVGALCWLVATQTTLIPLSGVLAAGLGLALGGGLGSVVWLAALGDDEGAESTETVTVDMDEADAGREPQPVDLFEASPDPILFYTEGSDGAVVRAVNPAFSRVFGVSSAALDGVPLREGVLVADRASDVVDAARDGRPFDETVPCETDDGERQMRVRIAATGDDRTDGYVLYAPTPEST